MKIAVISSGKTVDEVKSYTAFCKISTRHDANSLMTYDRKKVKINEAEVRKANRDVINELSK
jgi:hypothetical protein